MHFVNAFGPFFDSESLLLQAASREVVYEGTSSPWEPDPLTLKVMANELIETLGGTSDVEVLTRHYLEDQVAAPIELAALSLAGNTVVRLLEGVERHEAETLYSTLPPSFHEDMARISPSTHVGELRARLFVMHDQYDQVVPAAESRRLVKAARDKIHIRHTEFLAFDHMLPGAGGVFTRMGQAIRIYRHMYDIIRIAS